jgi:hypothetical protein
MSTGPNGGNGAFHAFCTGVSGGVSADGSHLFFRTAEKLDISDTDTSLDLYDRNIATGTTALVSIGPAGGNGGQTVFYRGSSANGACVWFGTFEKLTTDDGDTSYEDLYQNCGGATTLISTSPTSPNGPYGASFAGASDTGTHVFFTTDEKLTNADMDASTDIYDRETGAGTTTLVSIGPSGGNGELGALFQGNSSDGTRVWFQTEESLTPGDTDGGCPDAFGNPTAPCTDVYMRSGGATTLVSTSPTSPNGPYNADFGSATSDGNRVFFTTDEPLVAADTDNGCPDELGNPVLKCIDLYDRNISAGTTTFVSTSPLNPNGSYNVGFGGASIDGNQVFFATHEQFLAADTDGSADIYDHNFGEATTTLISTGSAGGNGPYDAGFLAVSENGIDSTKVRVIFQTFESLEPGDDDGGLNDIYERYSGATTWISRGLANSYAGGYHPYYDGSSKDLTRVFFDTDEALAGSDTDANQDTYISSVMVSTYPRPGGGSPLRVPLVPRFQACSPGSADSSHIAPLAFPSCSNPLAQSPLLTMGNGVASGLLKLTVFCNGGVPSETPPCNQTLAEDVKVVFAVSDVRCTQANVPTGQCPAANGAYGGSLIVDLPLRLTDQANGSSHVGAATLQDFHFAFPVGCVPNPPAIGASCDADTTANTLVPGAFQQRKRSVVSLYGVKVLDSGPDGSASPPSGCPPTCGTGDEQTYLDQGIFAP